MKRWLVGLVLGALMVSGGWLLGPRSADDTSIHGEAFATHYRITYRGRVDPDAVQHAVAIELQSIDAMASTWRDDSELMRYNKADEPAQFALSPALAELIEKAKQIEAQTHGAFSLRPDGGAIDLSGIAKGYAVDRVAELLQSKFGVTDCLVDIGGEVKAIGDGPQGDGWHVGLYLPVAVAGNDGPVLHLRDTSVATSGAYFKGDHILDPAAGQPVQNDLLSASVVHPSNTTADALATALFVMGSERGLAWAQTNGVRVLFLLNDGTRCEHVP